MLQYNYEEYSNKGLVRNDNEDTVKNKLIDSGHVFVLCDGMGGAVGALGSDFGAISVNPAASGIYRGGDFSLSTGFQTIGTSSNYLAGTMGERF